MKDVKTKDLIDYIAAHQVFNINSCKAEECMIELMSRSNSKKESTEFINNIDLEVKKLKDILNKKRDSNVTSSGIFNIRKNS